MGSYVDLIKSFASIELCMDKGHGVDFRADVFKEIDNLFIVCPHDSHIKQAGDDL